MQHLRKNHYFLTWAMGMSALAFALADALWAAPDPVDELRQALIIRPEDRRNPSETVLDFRRETLEKRIAALRSIGEMRRGLVEWKEDLDLVGKVQKLDEEMRTKLGNRLHGALRDTARRGSANSRLAVANLIAEMGPTIRALDPNDFGGYARSLAPIVVELVQDKDLGVRWQALRALGSINADPKIAVPVFKKVLARDEEEKTWQEREPEDGKGSRRLAAGGLLQLVKVVTHLHKRGQTKAAGVLASQPELVDAASEVVRATSAGLNDPDTQVRAICLEAIQASANAFADLPGAYEKKDFPPAGRPLAPKEEKEITFQYDLVQKRMDEIKSLLVAMANQGKNLDAALDDPEQSVKLIAVTALENMGHIRLRMKQRIDSLPPLKNVPLPKMDDDFNKMVVERLPGVATLLSDRSTEIRRAAIEYLENLQDDAVPASAALIERLGDRDRFIRWAAVRTLGNMPAAKVAAAVPEMAALLEDSDLDVRLAATAALERMGPYARAAVPVLDKGLLQGDPEFRIACMYALESIGPENAQSALPNLIRSLSYDVAADARVRRTAAEVLGRFGALAQPAVPALRQALGDDDADVRTRASDALLNILAPPAKE